MHNLCDIGDNNATLGNYKEFSGNIIPNSWYKKITTNTGKPDLNSIAILAEVVYWYRPSKDGTTKFKGDVWQTSYDHFEKKFGFNREAIRRIFVKLEQLKILTREFRTIEHRGYRYNNVLFLHLNIEKLFNEGVGEGKKISSQPLNFNTPSPQISGDYIDEKNKLEKKRSKKSDFCNFSNLVQPNEPVGHSCLQPITYFLPISDINCEFLNKSSGREFSTNFIKQLALKLSIKYPEYRFSTEKAFLNYMIKAIAHEKSQSAIVNNKDFKFANIPKTKEEEYSNNINKFLEKIELSRCNNLDSVLKRKILGRLAPDIAYEFLANTQIYKEKSILKLSINSSKSMSDSVLKIVFEEAKNIYGDSIDSIRTEKNGFKQKPIVNTIDNSEHINNNLLWKQVRERLRKYYGSEIDNAWFSKIIFKEENFSGKNHIILASPTSFIRDWIKTNYGLIIEKEISASDKLNPIIEFT